MPHQAVWVLREQPDNIQQSVVTVGSGVGRLPKRNAPVCKVSFIDHRMRSNEFISAPASRAEREARGVAPAVIVPGLALSDRDPILVAEFDAFPGGTMDRELECLHREAALIKA